LKREGAKRPRVALPFVANIVEQEKEMNRAAPATSSGRIAGTAAKLGIPRQIIESKIKSLGIDKHRLKAPQAH